MVRLTVLMALLSGLISCGKSREYCHAQQDSRRAFTPEAYATKEDLFEFIQKQAVGSISRAAHWILNLIFLMQIRSTRPLFMKTRKTHIAIRTRKLTWFAQEQ
ncbi:MAG: hypothetical protein QNK35_08745 [Bacteroides sp.]|nr:hypothetical protein [Bacteroides sp.]